jgi:uncharacterized protein
MKKIILIGVVGGIVLLAVFIFIFPPEKISNSPIPIQKSEEKAIKTVKIGEITLNIIVADTEAKRVQGLSGRDGLEENEGLLFVFETEGYYGFWMKDMKFPIDIAWLDKDRKIIYIEKNVSPETYPKVFYAFKADAPILNLYVLETKANFFEKSKIKIGDVAQF